MAKCAQCERGITVARQRIVEHCSTCKQNKVRRTAISSVAFLSDRVR